MSLTFGKPNENEALVCARLIHLSGPRLFEYVYAEAEPGLLDTLAAFVVCDGTTFSRENVVVARENGVVAGLIAALPVDGLRRGLMNELKCIRKMRGSFPAFLKTFSKMAFRAKLAAHYPPLRKNELFISNLAVFPEYRGRGIAARLLDKAEETAAERNLSALSLNVEIDNTKAIRLYERCGFTVEKKSVFPVKYHKRGLAGFYKMRKPAGR